MFSSCNFRVCLYIFSISYKLFFSFYLLQIPFTKKVQTQLCRKRHLYWASIIKSAITWIFPFPGLNFCQNKTEKRANQKKCRVHPTVWEKMWKKTALRWYLEWLGGFIYTLRDQIVDQHTDSLIGFCEVRGQKLLHILNKRRAHGCVKILQLILQSYYELEGKNHMLPDSIQRAGSRSIFSGYFFGIEAYWVPSPRLTTWKINNHREFPAH